MSSVLRFYRAGIVFSVIAFLSLATSMAGTITIGPNYIVYYDSAQGRYWSEAEFFALNNFGTHLASVHSLAELSEIEQLVADAGVPSFENVWIGGYESPPDSENFLNIDGTPWDFAAWAVFEPNPGEDCVGLGPSGSGGIADFSCSPKFAAMVINKPDSAPGEVPASGTPLLVATNQLDSTHLDFSWGVACGDNVSHYGIFEGVLGDFASHGSLLCGVTGTTASDLTPSEGNTYYLLVPYSSADAEEGSYGTDSSGLERPRGANPCQANQDLRACE